MILAVKPAAPSPLGPSHFSANRRNVFYTLRHDPQLEFINSLKMLLRWLKEREKEKEKERERERENQTRQSRDTDRQTDREAQTDRERQRETDTERERNGHTHKIENLHKLQFKRTLIKIKQ